MIQELRDTTIKKCSLSKKVIPMTETNKWHEQNKKFVIYLPIFLLEIYN